MMKRSRLIPIAVAAAACVAAAAPTYLPAAAFVLPDKLWDYASVDAVGRRLYVAGYGGVTTVDLRNGKVTPDLIRSALVHGVAALPGGMAAATNGDDATVTLFDGSSGQISATIAVGKGPDSIYVEPRHGWLVVTEEDGDSIAFIDIARRRVVKRVLLGGAPEAAVSDSRGTVFDNMGEKPEIAIVDPDRGTVTQRIPLPGCDAPTGIAYDRRSDLVMSVCRNGAVEVVSARSRTVRRTFNVGAGPDAVMADAERGRFFVPSGGTGELSVFQAQAGGDVNLIGRVATQLGSRTGAVDPVTGTVYIPAAVLLPPTEPGMRHAIEPGTFRVLTLTPR